jgi:hypothetical protein
VSSVRSAPDMHVQRPVLTSHGRCSKPPWLSLAFCPLKAEQPLDDVSLLIAAHLPLGCAQLSRSLDAWIHPLTPCRGDNIRSQDHVAISIGLQVVREQLVFIVDNWAQLDEMRMLMR